MEIEYAVVRITYNSAGERQRLEWLHQLRPGNHRVEVSESLEDVKVAPLKRGIGGLWADNQ